MEFQDCYYQKSLNLHRDRIKTNRRRGRTRNKKQQTPTRREHISENVNQAQHRSKQVQPSADRNLLTFSLVLNTSLMEENQPASSSDCMETLSSTPKESNEKPSDTPEKTLFSNSSPVTN
ncbi:hypothetical protein AVEN_133916-1 [Araneus ventricosus]|uniref:Uncharacterized protein n=1 Tax=Araneus ventricosus TaxID=182803 RepID=A0A4Y2D343_ARAVE|nr:hypothetical protein AVEN_133916-1 [Araneus ventricosus]